MCYVGSESEAQSVVKPFLDLGPVMSMVYPSTHNTRQHKTTLTILHHSIVTRATYEGMEFDE